MKRHHVCQLHTRTGCTSRCKKYSSFWGCFLFCLSVFFITVLFVCLFIGWFWLSCFVGVFVCLVWRRKIKKKTRTWIWVGKEEGGTWKDLREGKEYDQEIYCVQKLLNSKKKRGEDPTQHLLTNRWAPRDYEVLLDTKLEWTLKIVKGLPHEMLAWDRWLLTEVSRAKKSF